MKDTPESSFSREALARRKKESLEFALKALRGENEDPDDNYTYIDSGMNSYDNLFWGATGGFLTELQKAHSTHPETPVHVLDFGCGANEAVRQLVAANNGVIPLQATGASVGDVRTDEQKAFDREHNVRFIDVTSPSQVFEHEYYDTIVSKHTFWTLYDPLQEMRKLYRALRKGGTMYLAFPFAYLSAKFLDSREDLKTLDPHTLTARLDAALAQSKRLPELMRESGIDITVDPTGLLIIKKNDVPMQFPWVHYRTPNKRGEGLYELREEATTT